MILLKDIIETDAKFLRFRHRGKEMWIKHNTLQLIHLNQRAIFIFSSASLKGHYFSLDALKWHIQYRAFKASMEALLMLDCVLYHVTMARKDLNVYLDTTTEFKTNMLSTRLKIPINKTRTLDL